MCLTMGHCLTALWTEDEGGVGEEWRRKMVEGGNFK